MLPINTWALCLQWFAWLGNPLGLFSSRENFLSGKGLLPHVLKKNNLTWSFLLIENKEQLTSLFLVNGETSSLRIRNLPSITWINLEVLSFYEILRVLKIKAGEQISRPHLVRLEPFDTMTMCSRCKHGTKP